MVDDCEGMTEEDYWRGMDETMQDEGKAATNRFAIAAPATVLRKRTGTSAIARGKPIYDEEPAVSPAPTFADGMTAEDDKAVSGTDQ